MQHPFFAQPGSGLLDLYRNFIRDLEDRINPSSLVGLARAVAEQAGSPAAALEFLAPLEGKVRADAVARIQLLALRATWMLAADDLAAASGALETAEKALEALDGITAAHAAFYRAQAALAKRKGNYAVFYTTGLQYLGCSDVEALHGMRLPLPSPSLAAYPLTL